ncbi:acylneuraminate cytidylyltransferase family protein [Pontibacter sp. HSC-36F09]|uniref:acylneuraminate cytidylyltransferase family protein n=1 Tax=Pontibacter sp. HSC-36F09 TaxID=2910966 RepID=UPI00209F3CB3|nr:acylneuraminate cytidylyltransferase family protein [Pontibacter sp. HSC-36F09]MCP2043674.1 CMP-N-acetylneuraminic acid synthetase [Pontibacter sp. HSC-36F09]
MNILITICARGGSKGIPGKNIKELNGLPLIAYTINVANEFAKRYNADVSLSTDDSLIMAKAAEYGLMTSYIRPEILATDTAGKIDVIQDLVNYEESTRAKEYDFIVDLDVTSPMRTLQDLEEALKRIQSHPEALNIFSVNPANRNPYFNMVEEYGDGFVRVVKKAGDIKSRQAAPPVYDMNASFYIFRKSFFEQGYRTSTTERSLAYVMKHICFDLDHPIDFTIMEIMMRERLLDFEL